MATRSALLALALLLASVPVLGQETSTLILEAEGEAGGFKLGAKIRSYPGVKQVADDRYEIEAGGLELRTDGKEIAEIRVVAKRFATQKLIRPRQSTLSEVLETYGNPDRRCTIDGYFSARYGDLEFQTAYLLDGPLQDGDLPRLLASTVEAVVLRNDRDYKRSYERGFESFEAADWEELARRMERSLCDRPAGDPPSRVQTYGMKFLDYTPHYFLGLAWLELGRCEAARAEWKRSVERESLDRDRDKLARIEQGRQACGGSAPTASK